MSVGQSDKMSKLSGLNLCCHVFGTTFFFGIFYFVVGLLCLFLFAGLYIYGRKREGRKERMKKGGKKEERKN